ncbi:unnamed protein product [Mycena citricolor]|uniref:NmrA-like domain-containing protein n=1 Tax=Mycena citricolor TaxID=2018698 RepID=A0AAD2K952_9AGAR|nr:unnamed protein product [Mycena citricolor]
MSDNKKIIFLVGGTGAQGLAVIDALLAPDAEGNASPYTVRAGTFEDQAAIVKGLDGAYGAYINTDGFTVGEVREVHAGMSIFEAAKATPGLKHYVWSSVMYGSKAGGFKPEYRSGHLNGKGLVAEWVSTHASDASPQGLAWSIVTAGPYTDMLPSGLLEPLNVRKDGTVVFAAPLGDGIMPLVSLKDIGWWARYTFDHRTETSGRDLDIVSENITWDDLVKTFTKVTGKPAVYVPQTIDEWFANFHIGLSDAKIGTGSLTVKENFAGFWAVFRDRKVVKDVEWCKSVHPGTQSVEQWMRENNYQGKGPTSLKGVEDTGRWPVNEDVTSRL